MTEPTATEKKIMVAIENKNALLPCPRCGIDNKWYPANGFINLFLSPNEVDIMEKTAHRIVAAALICGNCGYISLHEIRRLMS
jgi:predicted RNA-binding Zn-ribbon protein involved in translation (DUF1610 family)